ncbi:hypothetical protein PSACC_01848 [Paramicrosporidium saccamoebae]|uniref:Uncharacterized protein n=1 Tax=Paramicrosporidium saccamoebae TaxID=1246581 RepID=A0A2H9TKN1_9FUNG|nr:hypothetical protein PSACC_01848 [Paramicrosporidium saccamoebae]
MTLDSDEWDWVAHFLPNLNRLAVISKPDSTTPQEFTQLVKPSTVEIRNEREHWTCRNVNIPKLHVERLPVRLASNVDSLECHSCKTTVSKGVLQVKELPGNYWMDLIDCWSCHQSEFAVVTEKLAFSQDGHEILPKTGQILHRGMFLLASLQDLAPCACLTEDGQLVTLAGAQEPTHIKIPLCSLNLCTETDSSSFVRLVSAELYDAMESTGSALFAISSGPQSDAILLTVLSWNSKFYLGSGWRSGMIVQKESKSHDDSAVSFIWSASLVERLKICLTKGFALAERFEFSAPTSIILE